MVSQGAPAPATPAVRPIVPMTGGNGATATEVPPEDLKARTARGAVVSMAAQAGTLVVRTVSLMVLARLLLKEDFGLVHMVTAVTGVLGLMYAGLSMATVQRASLTSAQTSTLFWLNVGMGGALAVVAAIIAPLVGTFYGEPRLVWVTMAVGTNFVISGASVQHRAMLQRSMRFSVLAIIDLAAIAASAAAGIALAAAGSGYWALVAMTVSQPLAMVVGVWWASGWRPGLPRRRSGIRPMLLYGGAVTVNNFIVYLAYNLDKVLVGRFWGAEALGVYGRAYHLINLPIDNLNSTIGLVALPALSRLQNDPARLARFFLGGYSLFLAVVMPTTIGAALFAEDIVLVFLGPKWLDAADIFRLLAPAILGFAFANPFTWVMLASGGARRCLTIALVVTPALILSYGLGLPHGPQGVALGFSITMVLATVPVVVWATRGTRITMRDIVRAVAPAAMSVALGAAAALAARPMVEGLEPVLLRLAAESSVLFGVHGFALLFIAKQKSTYLGLLRDTGLWAPGVRGTGLHR